MGDLTKGVFLGIFVAIGIEWTIAKILKPQIQMAIANQVAIKVGLQANTLLPGLTAGTDTGTQQVLYTNIGLPVAQGITDALYL